MCYCYLEGYICAILQILLSLTDDLPWPHGSSNLNKNAQKSVLETWISSSSLEVQLEVRTGSSIKIIFLNTNRDK